MGLGTYTATTFGQAKAALAARLDDPLNVHWADAELGLYIREALTEWQAMAGYWRDRGTATLAVGVPFYDLTTDLYDSGGNLMLAMTVKDSDLVPLIEYHLIEPPTIPWTGSTQFTLAEVTEALEGARDNFLSETGSVITHSVAAVPPTPIGRFPVDDHVVDVRRVAWLPTLPGPNLAHVPLWVTDEFAAEALDPNWDLTPDAPEAYSVLGTPPLQVQLVPPPIDNGRCDLLTVNSGATLDPTVGVLLGVPNNFVWAIKWGALAELLSQDGEPRDDFRAGYCRQRYEEACEVARRMPVVLTAALNGAPVLPQTVADLDGYRPDWAGSAGAPDAVGLAGQNLIAVAPPPDNALPYSFRADVVRNAVVPAADGDFLQVGREWLDDLLNEAQHLALFKSGGQEFADTLPLHQSFLRACGTVNDKLQALSFYLSAIGQQSTGEERARPRRESDVAGVTP